MCAHRHISACPVDVARCRRVLSICPRQAGVWRRVPGFDDEEASDDSEEEMLHALAEARFKEVVSILGTNETDTQLIEFSPPEFGEQDGTRPKQADAASPQGNSVAAIPATHRSQQCFFVANINAPLVADIFLFNGLLPTEDKRWSIRWSGPGLRDVDYKELQTFQRINHFPGSTELTRKDRMYQHVDRMKHTFGQAEFDFVPESYTLPRQVAQFAKRYHSVQGLWIVKPSNSSCGRGICILRSIRDLPQLTQQQNVVVSKYIDNPLLIQGLKFDLRIYVVVTSYDPLRAYIYREGLVRFACRLFSLEKKHLGDMYRHLTNYSVNKGEKTFLENQDADADNFGHKWSLSALNKHLRHVGLDVDLMWSRIMDIIVKSLLAVEPTISNRVRQVCVNRNSCFEVYGFDVLVDDDLKPWLLEVNLSPSMVADSPLDWRVKSSLLSDAFNLVGVQGRHRRGKPEAPSGRLNKAMPAMSVHKIAPSISKGGNELQKLALDSLSNEDLKLLARAFQEVGRCSNFIRLYPTKGSVARYQPIIEMQSGMVPRLQGIRLHYSPWVSLSQIVAFALFGPASKQPSGDTPGSGRKASRHLSLPGRLRSDSRRNSFDSVASASDIEDNRPKTVPQTRRTGGCARPGAAQRQEQSKMVGLFASTIVDSFEVSAKDAKPCELPSVSPSHRSKGNGSVDVTWSRTGPVSPKAESNGVSRSAVGGADPRMSIRSNETHTGFVQTGAAPGALTSLKVNASLKTTLGDKSRPLRPAHRASERIRSRPSNLMAGRAIIAMAPPAHHLGNMEIDL